MNPQKLARYAALCVEELDAHSGNPLSVQDISLRKGIPLSECKSVFHALSQAGIIRLVAAEHAVLLRQDVTALELVQAVWAKASAQQDFQMLFGGHHGKTMQTTWTYLMHSQPSSEEALNG